jgi:hypothetical protein
MLLFGLTYTLLGHLALYFLRIMYVWAVTAKYSTLQVLLYTKIRLCFAT